MKGIQWKGTELNAMTGAFPNGFSVFALCIADHCDVIDATVLFAFLFLRKVHVYFSDILVA